MQKNGVGKRFLHLITPKCDFMGTIQGLSLAMGQELQRPLAIKPGLTNFSLFSELEWVHSLDFFL